jgi:outer membrane protein assembly factor BamB
MEIPHIGLPGGMTTGMPAPATKSGGSEKLPEEQITLGGDEGGSKAPSAASMKAQFSNAAAASGLSLDALSGLFDIKSGPLWTFMFPHDPAPCSSTRGIGMGSDGALYTGVYKRIVKVDPATGNVLWKKDFDKEPSSCPFAEGKDGSLLLMDGYVDRLVALDPKTGDERWHYDCNKTGLWDPLPTVAPDGSIYTYHGEKLAVLSPKGKEKYKVRVGKYSPTVHGIDASGQAVVSSGNELVVLNANGKELWRVKDGGNNTHYYPKDGEHVFISMNERLTAHKRDTGAVLWERTPADMNMKSTTLLGASEGKLLVTDGMNRNTLLCLDSATGTTQWENKMSSGDKNRYVQIFDDKRLLTVKEDDRFYALDLDSGAEKWSVKITPSTRFGSQALSPTGTLYVQMDKTIYGFNADTGAPVSRNDGFATAGALIPGADGKTIYTQDGSTFNVQALDTRNIDEKAGSLVNKMKDDADKANESSPGPKIDVEDDFILIDGLRIERKQ